MHVDLAHDFPNVVFSEDAIDFIVQKSYDSGENARSLMKFAGILS